MRPCRRSIWDAARPQAERKGVKTMLKIRGLESCYGESCIVSGLTLDVPKGEIVGLIGRNGVGKSTTLKSIMGLVKKHRTARSNWTARILSAVRLTSGPAPDWVMCRRAAIFSRR